MWGTCQRFHHPLINRLAYSLKKQANPFITNKCASLHVVPKGQLQDDFSVYDISPTVYWADRLRQPKTEMIVSSQPRQLVVKTMKDSYVEKCLPFKSNSRFLDDYIFSNGNIRVGKLLEELDILAGTIALKHLDNGDPNAPPISIATASFDRFDLFQPNTGIKDYKFSGHVSYVGSSSMEIFIKAEAMPEGSDTSSTQGAEKIGILDKNTVVLATRITMVGVDPVTQRPVKINPLRPTSSAEQRLFDIGEANKQRKKQMRAQENVIEVSDMPYFVDGSDNTSVYMENTTINSNFLMLPQDRNLNDKIFGGYLMRRAYELAHANTSLFMKSYPTFVSMDEAIFKKPIEIGSVLNLKSTIVLSEGHPNRTVQVRVVAEMAHVNTGAREITNIFHFTLATDEENAQLPRVIPKTDEEKKLWSQAKRRNTQGVRDRQAILESEN